MPSNMLKPVISAFHWWATNRACESLSGTMGRGFSVHESTLTRQTSGGYGLFNIKERLASLGGWVVVESEPGHGAAITLIVPLDSDFNER